MPLQKINERINKVEGFALTGLLVIMIGFAFSQVVLRNFFNTGISWADAFVRHLVLWVGFIGASVATEEDGHLAMDLVSRFLPEKIKNATAGLVRTASAFVCACLTVASYKFVMGEKEGGNVLLPGVPTYWAISIIPIGFYLMSVRFARKAHLVLGIFVALALPLIVFSQDISFLKDSSLFLKLQTFSDMPLSKPVFTCIVIGIGLIGLFGAPLFIIFGSISLLAFKTAGIDSSATIIEMYRLASAPTLVAIPLFTFAGYLMAESKTPERLIAVAKPLFGWMPGGLAIMTIVACAFFTAFTGASGVTIIALGGLLYPILVKENYPDGFSMGLVTTCGSVGLMFPPSLPLILFGLISGASIDKLFMAGLLPGLLIIAILGSYSIFRNRGISRQRHPFSLKELLGALRGAAWELPLPFIILFGIYGGFVTASEAAAVTAFYVFFVQVFIYRDLKITKDIPRIAKQSMVLVGSIVVIFAVAMGFTSYLIDEQVPMKLFEWIRTYITSKWVFLLALNIFLLIVGSLMDIFSAIIVVVPLIIPIAKEFAVDPIHLGIIFLTNLEIGYLHPPVGLNLFLSSIRFKRSIVNLYWVTLPFLLLLVLALLIITYVPDLSLWLVHHLTPATPPPANF
ncbi:MAG: TRAP transporter large permease subunit [bacterium]